MNPRKIRGLVLAGGKSSRFGADKAMAVYEGKTFLERAVFLLKSLGLKPIVLARRGTDYPIEGLTVLYDKLPDLGPLGGIYTAMRVFPDTDLLVTTCDMPFMVRELLSHLIELRSHEDRGAFFETSGVLQPFPGIYPSSAFPLVRRQLLQGDLSLHSVISSMADKSVTPFPEGTSHFLNINRKSDLPVR